MAHIMATGAVICRTIFGTVPDLLAAQAYPCSAVFLFIVEHVLVELIFGQAPLASVALAQLGKLLFASFTSEQHLGSPVEIHDVFRMECEMSAAVAR